MSERKGVEIICDGNAMIGMGHIRRSSALAAALHKEKIAVRLSGLSEEAGKWLPETTATLAGEASVVVFDVAEGIEQLIADAKQKKQTTITLDWFGNAVPDINIAVYPHSEVKASIDTYIGFDYIILREQIRDLAPIRSTKQMNKVLVCLGGGDLLGQGFEAAVFLKNNGMDVTLVQGPLAKIIPGEHGFPILINPPDFPELLAGCDWAVTNGGGCLFEALYFEKPTYILPQTEWENRIAAFVYEAGYAFGIGQETLHTFSSSKELPVVRHTKKLVDGNGVERITAIIKKVV